MDSLPPRWRKGRGWWCGYGKAGRALTGAGALQGLSPDNSDHTTTQPSSIEEEGF